MVLERVRDNITSVRGRLVNTIIENRDVEKIISSYDRSSTFFYCDTPYYGLTDYTSQGSKPFTKKDHVRLKECLSKIQGKFLLSINDHPEIRKLYSEFNINQVEVRYSVCRTGGMKIYAAPIEVLAWFENGKPHPLRFKYKDKELKIEQVISVTEEKLAGNRMIIFRCQSEVNEVMKVFELKYELQTCKWLLWKM